MEPNVFLEGISLGTTEVPRAECSFPTINHHCNPIVLETKGYGQGIYYKEATSKIGSLSALLSAGCAVHFEQGQQGNHEYGGTITLPDGTMIIMTYTSGTWRLPTLTKQKAAKLHHRAYLSAIKSLQATISDSLPTRTEPCWNTCTTASLCGHPYCLLTSPLLRRSPDVKIMQLLHHDDRWGHPSNSKMEMIFRYYQGRGFPKGFLAAQALKNFKCKTCTLHLQRSTRLQAFEASAEEDRNEQEQEEKGGGSESSATPSIR
eukprot:2123093-Rhodomonas_salina.1